MAEVSWERHPHCCGHLPSAAVLGQTESLHRLGSEIPQEQLKYKTNWDEPLYSSSNSSASGEVTNRVTSLEKRKVASAAGRRTVRLTRGGRGAGRCCHLGALCCCPLPLSALLLRQERDPCLVKHGNMFPSCVTDEHQQLSKCLARGNQRRWCAEYYTEYYTAVKNVRTATCSTVGIPETLS